MFEDATIDIPCPGCGHKHRKTLGWIQANDHIACVCGASIELEKSGLTRGLDEVEKSLSDFKRNLGRMFR